MRFHHWSYLSGKRSEKLACLLFLVRRRFQGRDEVDVWIWIRFDLVQSEMHHRDPASVDLLGCEEECTAIEYPQ